MREEGESGSKKIRKGRRARGCKKRSWGQGG